MKDFLNLLSLDYYYYSYLTILIFLLILFFIATLIISLIFYIVNKNLLVSSNQEKILPYECGFDPYEDPKNTFEIQFYIISILFLVFDLETVLLFPWVIIKYNIVEFWIGLDFIIELLVSYIYVWKRNILNLKY